MKLSTAAIKQQMNQSYTFSRQVTRFCLADILRLMAQLTSLSTYQQKVYLQGRSQLPVFLSTVC